MLPIVFSVASAGQPVMLVSSPPPLPPSNTAEPSSSSGHSAPVPREAVTAPDSSLPPVVASSPKSKPSFSPSLLSECRKLLIPVIHTNAKVRNPGVDGERVKLRAEELLTNEQCSQFIRLAIEARKQTQTGPKRARHGSEDSSDRPPKVPRHEPPEDEMPVAEGANRAASEAEVDELMAAGGANNTPGTPAEPSPARSSAPEAAANAQSPRNSRAATPLNANTGGNTDREGDPTPSDVKDDEDTLQPQSDRKDMPPASRTEAIRVLSEHASAVQEVASSPSTTTSSRGGADPQFISPSSLPPPESPASAEDETPPKDATSHESSHHEPVTSHIEDEPVAPPPHDDDMDRATENSTPEEQHPPCVVPGLWSAIVGRSSPGVDVNDFFVDDATADAVERWARRRNNFRSVRLYYFGVSSRANIHRLYSLNDRHVQVHLLCLPHSAAASAFADLPPNPSPGDIATAMWNIKSIWPPQGHLVVELNRASQDSDANPAGRAWLPRDFVSNVYAQL